MQREVIDTDKAPHTGGPYAQAIRFGNLVFASGQVALDPATTTVVEGDIRAQTRRVLDNIAGLLEASGTSLSNSLDALCFLRNAEDFDAYNEVYRSYFPTDGPARATVIAANPRIDMLLQIRIIAAIVE